MENVWIDIGHKLHTRQWNMGGTAVPVLLVHGLASNAQTWDGVARYLAEWGHPVVAVDQRGHGRSDKPESGYDFETVTADLHTLIQTLGWEKPIIAGQSWGGNVALAFGATYPDVASAIIFVDGGFIDLQARPNSDWAQIEIDLKPPLLAGLPFQELESRIRQAHPDWSAEGLAGSMANFEHLPDGTIRPWLDWPRHHQILRALWEQRPQELYPLVKAPVFIAAATNGTAPDPQREKRVDTAVQMIPNATLHWFTETAHDIHIHRPHALAQQIEQFQQNN